MKIIVRTKEKKLRLWLPGGLLYGRISARIAIAAIRKHAPNCGHPAGDAGQLLTSLRTSPAPTPAGCWWEYHHPQGRYRQNHPLIPRAKSIPEPLSHKAQGAAPTPCGDSSFF